MNYLHISIYQEHLSELGFLQAQRRLALGTAEFDLHDLQELDGRMEAHLDGLVIGSREGLARFRHWGIDHPEWRYGLARLACRLDRPDLLKELIAAAELENPDERAALYDALVLELPTGWTAWLEGQLAQDSPAWTATLASAGAQRRLPIGPAVAAAAQRVPPEFQPDFLEPLGRLREARALMLVFRYLQQDAHPHGKAAAQAGLRIAPAQVVPQLRAAEAVFSWAAIPLAVSAHPPVEELLRHLGQSPDATRDALLALGLRGDIRAVPPLIEALDQHPQAASSAAVALHLLTGAGLSEHPPHWLAWWDSHRTQFNDTDARYRLGRPYGHASVVQALGDTRIPPDVREWMADELFIRHGIDLHYTPHMLAVAQRQRLSSLSPSPFERSNRY